MAKARTAARWVGLDVGGTKVRAFADAGDDALLEHTEATQSDVVSQLERLAVQLGGGSLAGVGIGVPGSVHPRTGVIAKVPNVPALDGVALADVLGARLGVPVAVVNDVAAAAFAEAAQGGHDGRDLAVIAAGTGIGLGLVVGGEVVHGATGAAGEIADMPVGDGILEDRVSAAGLRRAFQQTGGGDGIDVAEILTAAAANEARATTAVASYAWYLAVAVRTVVALADPATVVLTGGIGSHPVVAAAVHAMLEPELRARVCVSRLGDRSPAHGALLLAAG